MAKYVFVFSDGSPQLQTGEMTDDADAVAFAKVVATEIGREAQRPAPDVTVLDEDDGMVTAKEVAFACTRCLHEQRLAGIEQHANELWFTFVCVDCGILETRTVSKMHQH